MGVLSDVLAYKANKEKQNMADIEAIPIGIKAFTDAKTAAQKSQLDLLTNQISAAKSGLRIDQNQNGGYSLTPDKKLLDSITTPVYQMGRDADGNPTLIEAGQVPKGSQVKQQPQSAQEIQTGTDEDGNPIYKSVAQGRYDVSSDRAEQSQWDKLIKTNDPSVASSRSTLGMASNANIRANRALTLLDSPTTTKQDLGLVIEDLGGIMMGGVPTDQAMSLTDYNTLTSKVQAAKQFLSGVPEGAIPPKIKDKLRATLTDLKKLDYDFISNHLDMQEAGQKQLVSKRPDDWKSFREKIMNDPYKQMSSSSDVKSFDSVEALNAAKLPKGTKVKVGNQTGVVS